MRRSSSRQVLVLWALLAGCGGIQSSMQDSGVEASRIVQLWWLLFGISALVFVVVAAFLFLAIRRVPRAAPGEQAAEERGLHRAILAGVIATVVLLLVIFIATLVAARPLPGAESPAVTIRVEGKLWWWEVTYLSEEPEQVFTTANELHIPVERPVRIELVSDNVIHSFWVPRLGGKMDLIPGRVNHMTLLATEPGVYRGQCAEFCGLQHAKMAFWVVAEPPEAFDRWLAHQRTEAAVPDEPLARRGREVFLGSQCMRCHTIRGVSRAVEEGLEEGPELTHLASRLSLAAGILPNRRGHLGGWIANPQAIKPGNLMPRVPLSSEDFRALLHYLETLE